MVDLFKYSGLLFDGLLVTVGTSVGAAIVMLIIAFSLGIAATLPSAWIRWPVRLVVEFFRGTSCFVQLFWAFYALPFFGVYLEPITVGILTIGINLGCFGSEVVRGAIEAVDKDQLEGAKALNYSRYQTMRYVILPQATVTMIPPLGNLMIELIKTTPLLSLITIADLTFQAQVMRQQTGDTAFAFSIIIICYFLLSSIIAFVASKAEERFDWNLKISFKVKNP